MTALCPPRLITLPERVSMTYRAQRQDLIENIEWLLRFNCGEAEILRMTGRKPKTLESQLRRAGRPDLIPKIFTWNNTEHDRRIER